MAVDLPLPPFPLQPDDVAVGRPQIQDYFRQSFGERPKAQFVIPPRILFGRVVARRQFISH
jgi:hypothetical protein